MTTIFTIISIATLLLVITQGAYMDDLRSDYEALAEDTDLILNDLEEIKERLKDIHDFQYRPPIVDEEIKLSEQELEVLEGLANMLSFDGTLKKGGDSK